MTITQTLLPSFVDAGLQRLLLVSVSRCILSRLHARKGFSFFSGIGKTCAVVTGCTCERSLLWV